MSGGKHALRGKEGLPNLTLVWSLTLLMRQGDMEEKVRRERGRWLNAQFLGRPHWTFIHRDTALF